MQNDRIKRIERNSFSTVRLGKSPDIQKRIGILFKIIICKIKELFFTFSFIFIIPMIL